MIKNLYSRRRRSKLSLLSLAAFLSYGSLLRAEPQSDNIESAVNVVDLKTGLQIPISVLLKKIEDNDITLLGELHDSVFHHKARAQLLLALSCTKCTIISEHLPAGQQVVFSDNLSDSLKNAGFDFKGWGWPLHEPLFRAIEVRRMPLLGGDISSTLSADIYRRGEEAIPSIFREKFRQSALSDAARSKLDDDLRSGHCGKLPSRYVPPMRMVQRVKDSFFAHALVESSPSILIAGNGHVRKDYGVPQILVSAYPKQRVVSVGFIEQEQWTQKAVPALFKLYDYVWISPNTAREDPCKNFLFPHGPKNNSDGVVKTLVVFETL
jgi:uncharacterized iron-regulated protein